MTSPLPRRIPTFAPHLKFQVSGQFGAEGTPWEIFSYSINVQRAADGAPPAAYLNGVFDDLLAFHGRPATGIGSFALVRELKCADVLPNGKWVGATPLLRRAVAVPGGNQLPGGLLTHAPQVALAVTLRTATPGPRARGRFYLPLPIGQAQTADGLISVLAAQSVADSVATLVNAVNARGVAGTGASRVAVASTWGPITPVNRVQVGRILDTIRSRRNATREIYIPGPAII